MTFHIFFIISLLSVPRMSYCQTEDANSSNSVKLEVPLSVLNRNTVLLSLRNTSSTASNTSLSLLKTEDIPGTDQVLDINVVNRNSIRIPDQISPSGTVPSSLIDIDIFDGSSILPDPDTVGVPLPILVTSEDPVDTATELPRRLPSNGVVSSNDSQLFSLVLESGMLNESPEIPSSEVSIESTVGTTFPDVESSEIVSNITLDEFLLQDTPRSLNSPTTIQSLDATTQKYFVVPDDSNEIIASPPTIARNNSKSFQTNKPSIPNIESLDDLISAFPSIAQTKWYRSFDLPSTNIILIDEDSKESIDTDSPELQIQSTLSDDVSSSEKRFRAQDDGLGSIEDIIEFDGFDTQDSSEESPRTISDDSVEVSRIRPVNQLSRPFSWAGRFPPTSSQFSDERQNNFLALRNLHRNVQNLKPNRHASSAIHGRNKHHGGHSCSHETSSFRNIGTNHVRSNQLSSYTTYQPASIRSQIRSGNDHSYGTPNVRSNLFRQGRRFNSNFSAKKSHRHNLPGSTESRESREGLSRPHSHNHVNSVKSNLKAHKSWSSLSSQSKHSGWHPMVGSKEDSDESSSLIRANVPQSTFHRGGKSSPQVSDSTESLEASLRIQSPFRISRWHQKGPNSPPNQDSRWRQSTSSDETSSFSSFHSSPQFRSSGWQKSKPHSGIGRSSSQGHSSANHVLPLINSNHHNRRSFSRSSFHGNRFARHHW